MTDRITVTYGRTIRTAAFETMRVDLTMEFPPEEETTPQQAMDKVKDEVERWIEENTPKPTVIARNEK